ncbi:DUF6283 family protein [Thiolinea disciformis]|uniref:DUF6283 family protein n=1 Tax=Thiolinea disciformis TaxID=125614 RepID=UPI000375E36E|nr:DUF6283 family protein [Thiolinea disciformis]
MQFNLKRPCANCPFRNDKPDQQGWLGALRAADIIVAITAQQGTFSCHKTTDIGDEGEVIETKNTQHCAGALILLEKIERPNQMMRWMERIGKYDRNRLDMNAPVFDNTSDFIEFHR